MPEDDLGTYARKMARALAKGDRFFKYNRDILHASIVVCLGMQYAKRSVLILSNKLDERLYGSDLFLDVAGKFVSRGGLLDILVETELPDDHPVWGIVGQEGQGKVTVRRVSDDMQKQYGYNFLVADDNGYRFERDREHPKAVVSFNDDGELNRGIIKSLKDIFAVLREDAEEVPAPA